MNFEFATAQRIVFGSGRLRQLPALVQGMGRRAALVTGSSAERIMPVFQALKENGANPAAFSIKGEPTTGRIAELARQAREQGCDFVVNLTNEGWFAYTSELEQLLAISVFRAVENRVGVLRAGNTGITVAIPPTGVLHHLRQGRGGGSEEG